MEIVKNVMMVTETLMMDVAIYEHQNLDISEQEAVILLLVSERYVQMDTQQMMNILNEANTVEMASNILMRNEMMEDLFPFQMVATIAEK